MFFDEAATGLHQSFHLVELLGVSSCGIVALHLSQSLIAVVLSRQVDGGLDVEVFAPHRLHGLVHALTALSEPKVDSLLLSVADTKRRLVHIDCS